MRSHAYQKLYCVPLHYLICATGISLLQLTGLVDLARRKSASKLLVRLLCLPNYESHREKGIMYPYYYRENGNEPYAAYKTQQRIYYVIKECNCIVFLYMTSASCVLYAPTQATCYTISVGQRCSFSWLCCCWYCHIYI